MYSIRILYPIMFLTCSEREGGRKKTGLHLWEDEQHGCVPFPVVWTLTRTAPGNAQQSQDPDVNWVILHRSPPRFWNWITFEHFTDTESMCRVVAAWTVLENRPFSQHFCSAMFCLVVEWKRVAVFCCYCFLTLESSAWPCSSLISEHLGATRWGVG